MVQTFKDLIVWQKSMQLVPLIYSIVAELPASESFVLSVQIRKCAVSIPSNIAEGRRRATRKDFAQFLNIALGSAAELETQLYIVNKLYTQIDCKEAFALIEEVQKMLGSMIRQLRVKKV